MLYLPTYAVLQYVYAQDMAIHLLLHRILSSLPLRHGQPGSQASSRTPWPMILCRRRMTWHGHPDQDALFSSSLLRPSVSDKPCLPLLVPFARRKEEEEVNPSSILLHRNSTWTTEYQVIRSHELYPSKYPSATFHSYPLRVVCRPTRPSACARFFFFSSLSLALFRII